MSKIILFSLNVHSLKVSSVLISYVSRSNLTWTQRLFLSFIIKAYNPKFSVISIRGQQNYFRQRKEKNKTFVAPYLIIYPWKTWECSKICNVAYILL